MSLPSPQPGYDVPLALPFLLLSCPHKGRTFLISCPRFLCATSYTHALGACSTSFPSHTPAYKWLLALFHLQPSNLQHSQPRPLATSTQTAHIHIQKMLVSVISLLAAATAVSAQSSNAPVVANNPIGAKYVATLPQKAGSPLAGSIEGATAADGKGVKFTVHFSGLPATGGPFMYHIHAKPVPADGNCTATGAHLDPYHYGEDKACDPTKPEICQTGDLSGKYGKFSTQEFSAEYTDLYSATLPSDPAFVRLDHTM